MGVLQRERVCSHCVVTVKILLHCCVKLLQRGALIPGIKLAVVCIGIGNIIKKTTPTEDVPTQVPYIYTYYIGAHIYSTLMQKRSGRHGS